MTHRGLGQAVWVGADARVRPGGHQHQLTGVWQRVSLFELRLHAVGATLEEPTGVRQGRLVEQGVVAALGMKNTWVEPRDSDLPHLAVGHRVGHAVERWYAIPLPGASGVVSSVPDMLTYPGIVVLGNSRDPTISSIGRPIMRTLAGIEP